jgi:tight adherence protein C
MFGNTLFFLLAFVTVSALLWCGFQLMQNQEDPLGDRLEALQSASVVSGHRPSGRKKGKGFRNSFLYAIGSIPGAEDWIKENEKRLRQAGFKSPNAIAYYTMFAVFFLLVLVFGMVWLQRNNTPAQMIGGLVAALLMGFMLPNFVLQKLAKRYRAKLQQALPDTVDLLGIVLGTGLALDQAMLRVSEEMQYIYPELANEFYTVVMQVRAGQERGKAFQALVRRSGIEDIKSLSAMIIQSERFGTSLSQALKVYADSLRDRRRLRAEAAVGKAGIKMLFPIVIFILPVLFVITLVPGMLSVLHDLALLRGGK